MIKNATYVKHGEEFDPQEAYAQVLQEVSRLEQVQGLPE